MSNDRSVFSDHRQLIDSILDQLIPANADGNIPAAGAHGIASYLAKISNTDADAGRILARGFIRANELLQSSGGTLESLDNANRVEFVKQLEQQDPAFFSVLLRHTYMGYYSRADIRPLFGLSSQPTQPSGYEVPLESPAEMASLTRGVKKRGQCFREC